MYLSRWRSRVNRITEGMGISRLADTSEEYAEYQKKRAAAYAKHFDTYQSLKAEANNDGRLGAFYREHGSDASKWACEIEGIEVLRG